MNILISLLLSLWINVMDVQQEDPPISAEYGWLTVTLLIEPPGKLFHVGAGPGRLIDVKQSNQTIEEKRTGELSSASFFLPYGFYTITSVFPHEIRGMVYRCFTQTSHDSEDGYIIIECDEIFLVMLPFVLTRDYIRGED